ncbi:carboxyl transferase domain-containing protein [Mollicutes bacterium LVI A0039]|nr:carboxyl transferase domain-containing protein [Mollicutes bacterium LVI A0039]
MSKINNLNLIRSEGRLTGKQLVDVLFPDFEELKGDRLYGDDSAIVCGIATLFDKPVTVVAQNKGANFEERVANNFGMAHPEGYRKAERMFKLAEKFNRPIITIVDTAGAYPGIESEERGQASSIANCLMTLADIKVPVITIILSEGGSGGALALAHADYIYSFENAYYSVISPEGYAEILYKSEKSVEEIIDDLPIFADSLQELGIVDYIIPEPEGGICLPIDSVQSYKLQEHIANVINSFNPKQIRAHRYERFRKFGR